MKRVVFIVMFFIGMLAITACNNNNKHFQKESEKAESVIQNEETETPEVTEEPVDSLEETDDENNTDE